MRGDSVTPTESMFGSGGSNAPFTGHEGTSLPSNTGTDLNPVAAPGSSTAGVTGTGADMSGHVLQGSSLDTTPSSLSSANMDTTTSSFPSGNTDTSASSLPSSTMGGSMTGSGSGIM